MTVVQPANAAPDRMIRAREALQAMLAMAGPKADLALARARHGVCGTCPPRKTVATLVGTLETCGTLFRRSDEPGQETCGCVIGHNGEPGPKCWALEEQCPRQKW